MALREIIFRGKRIDNGDWVYGDYASSGCGIVCMEYLNEHGDAGEVFHPVDLKTIGQFTGLTTNGKKIFEGDLLNGFQYPFYRSESDEHNYFAEVLWFPGNCAFGLYTHKHPTAKVRGISAGNADFIEDFNSDDWEVIGNIHDNPELVEG